jgi:multidrug efflux pump subunit AcrB
VNFSAWTIRWPLPAILLFAFLCVGGLLGFQHVGITAMPVIDVPVVSVDASLPGATPSQMENELTRKIEDAIAGIGSVKNLTSTVTPGSSSSTVSFDLRVNPRDALDEVRDAVGRIRADLPPGTGDPVIVPVNHADLLLSYAVSSRYMDQQDLSRFVDTELQRVLLAIPGVARVVRNGGVDREIHVDLDAARLRALRSTVSTVSAQLDSALRDTPGGRTESAGYEQALRVTAPGSSVEQLRQLEIAVPGGPRVWLGDLAQISDTTGAARQLALLDGKPVVAVQIYHASGPNEVEVARQVRAALSRLTVIHPGLRLREIDDAVRPIQAVFNTAMSALYEGCVLAVVVVWIFLRNWRATAVAACALPLSIMPTFLALALLGFTFNQLTLLALILVIGVLVDDAIVEVENIARHMRSGKPPRQAALDATGEIYLAVIATSLTLVAVFLPTAFMGGVIGKYFKDFGWTVAIAVLASLLVARLITPMLAARLLREEAAHAEQPRDGRLMSGYLALVGRLVKHPLKATLAGVMLCAASLALLAGLPKGFLPAQEQSRIVVTLRTAPGSSIEATRAAAEAAQRAAAGIPEIASTLVVIGSDPGESSGDANSDVDEATLTYWLLPVTQRVRSQAQLEAELQRRLAALPGVRFAISTQDSGQAVSVVLASDDDDLLHHTAVEVERQLRGVRGLAFVNLSANVLRPELDVVPNPAAAAQLGVTGEALGKTLRIATVGDTAAALPRLNLAGRQVPVRVRLDPAQASAPALLEQLLVPGKAACRCRPWRTCRRAANRHASIAATASAPPR